MKLVLAVDPGKASGVALFEYDGTEPRLISSGEYQMREYAKPIRDAISLSKDKNIPMDIVCERFTINMQTVKNSQAPYSLEQIGV